MNYRALRHTYGFGIHSPFAYRMITDVIRPGRGYAWYGYGNIDAVVNSGGIDPRIERKARMFHRLICFLTPSSLFLPIGTNPAYYAAAEGVATSMKIERKPSEAAGCVMIATHADFIPLDILKRHLQAAGNSAVVLNSPAGWIGALTEALPEGLVFYGKKNAIFVNRPGMMKVAYEILL